MVKKKSVAAKKRKMVCLVCKQEKQGLPVMDDQVIRLIRRIKSRLGVARGNVLVVCEDDVEKALAKRSRFERYVMLLALLGAVMLVLALLGAKSLLAGITVGMLSAGFVVALALLIYYPCIEHGALEAWKKKRAAKKKRVVV